MEEAFAETRARVKVVGVKEALVGIRFPLRHGYVYLIRRGADRLAFDPRHYGGSGVLREASGIVSLGGGPDWVYNLYLSDR